MAAGQWVIEDTLPAVTARPPADGQWVIEDAPKAAPSMPWSDVPLAAVKNTPASAGRFAQGMYQAVRHPLDTIGGLGDAAAGGIKNLLPKGVTDFVDQFDPNPEAGRRAVDTADAYGQFYKDRFGSEEAFKNTIANDPVGLLGDVSMLFGGGATLAGRVPQVANKLSAAQRYTNPVNVVKPIAGGIASKASSMMDAIEQKVAIKAAKDAASETASARSAAGNAAQNAYKQLEHLRELKAFRNLSADEAAVAHALEIELAGKAVDKLVPADALKSSTSQAYIDAMRTEPARAASLAAERLSVKEAGSQAMARVKRYGPAVAGGMLFGNLLFPGIGGALGGATSGLVLRPAIRSMFRLAKTPAVQHGLLSPFSNSGLLADAAGSRFNPITGNRLLFANQLGRLPLDVEDVTIK